MRVVLTRVKEASVHIDDDSTAEIGLGYLLLVGLTHTDTESTVIKMAEKVSKLRIMDDPQGKMNLSLADAKGSILAVPNFTLYADTKGNRPGFLDAAKPSQASVLFDSFIAQLIAKGHDVKSGQFGAHMIVRSENDGPLTLVLDIV